jgi:biopolymer transport protein ExbD
MDASMLNSGDNQSNLKVSISTRLVAALSYTIPAIGGALSSLLLMRVMQQMAMAETAGVGAVMAGIKEASLPSTISLYLAAVCGIVLIIVLIVRMTIQTKTATPPIWFFFLGGIIGLLPAALFWIAKWLIIEALSPGSSIGTNGVSGVGARIAQLLTGSVIAAPIVILFLLAASVLPLRSRSKTKWLSLAGAALIEISLIAVAVVTPFLINEPKRKNELVNLPKDIKFAESDYNIERETSTVLILTADNKLYERQAVDSADSAEIKENIITREELPERLKRQMELKTPDRRVVYFKCDVNASFENVLQIFDIIRKADVDKIGLVVVGKKDEIDDPYQISPLRFEVNLPVPIEETDAPAKLRPNPLTLMARLESNGKLSLNMEDMGLISDTKKLENLLVRVFKEREDNGVFREGTNEVEKKVFVRVSKSCKYGDFIRLVEAVKGAGANPIVIHFDDTSF